MNEKHWEVGEDDEELFEYAMHPAQYEAYRSGKAKVDFKVDVAKRRAEKEKANTPTTEVALPKTPQVMTVDVNGQAYRVTVAFGDTATNPAPAATPAPQPAAAPAAPAQGGREVLSGDVICYVEAMKTYNTVRSEFSGTITAICVNPGDSVSEDDVLMIIQ